VNIVIHEGEDTLKLASKLALKHQLNLKEKKRVEKVLESLLKEAEKEKSDAH
jgi:transcriptional regulator